MTGADDGNAQEKDNNRRRKFIGFSESVEIARQRRESKPRPWFERKFIVAIVIGIVGYTWYVYVARLCVLMIRGDKNALGGLAMGVAFLVVFCFLGLMFWWSYLKLLFTPPGFAKDFVQRSATPNSNPWLRNRRNRPSIQRTGSDGTESVWSSGDEIGGSPYDELPPSQDSLPNEHHDTEKHAKSSIQYEKQGTAQSPIEAPHSMTPRDYLAPPPRSPSKARLHDRGNTSRNPSGYSHQSQNGQEQSSSAQNAPTEVDEQRMSLNETTRMDGPPHSGGTTGTHAASTTSECPSEKLTRRPPQHPALLPEYRYCYKDEFVKPMRAHHCRICGTCVLRFDHHCPWIGQCVGAFNHKFFVIFLLWSSLWTLWILSTAVGLLARNGGDNLDPQLVVIIALSGFFSLFTITLYCVHVDMIFRNQTTVEQMVIHNMRSRERAIMDRLVPLWDWGHSNVHKRRSAIRKEWDHEWGNLDTEGNLWWLGSKENWLQMMGRNRWGWFLPIGRSLPDGLTYPTNPRFDHEGRWRRRTEWPAELQ